MSLDLFFSHLISMYSTPLVYDFRDSRVIAENVLVKICCFILRSIIPGKRGLLCLRAYVCSLLACLSCAEYRLDLVCLCSISIGSTR